MNFRRLFSRSRAGRAREIFMRAIPIARPRAAAFSEISAGPGLGGGVTPSLTRVCADHVSFPFGDAPDVGDRVDTVEQLLGLRAFSRVGLKFF